MIGMLRSISSRLLAVAILGAVVFGAIKLVIEPIAAEHGGIEDEIAQQRILLGRLLTAEAEAGGAKPQNADQLAVFVEGETDAIRLANLQSRLSEAAQAINARLSSTQAVEPRQTPSVRLIGVQTQFSTKLELLQKLLFDLETSRPALIVDTLHVSRGPDRDKEEVTDLDVRMVILGATPLEKGQP